MLVRFPFASTTLRPLLVAAGLLALTSCGSSDNPSPDSGVSDVFVVNEGVFQKSDAKIAGFNSNTGKVVTADLFQSTNNQPLGDVAQSMTVVEDRAYIVVNNSNKVEVVTMPSLKEVGPAIAIFPAPVAPDTATRLLLPRYFVANNGKGYVSQWVSYTVPNGRVSVVDLATNKVTKTIQVGLQPERMLMVDNKVYVVNSGGNTVSVINTQNDEVESTITVDDAPNSLVQDANGKIRVLCGGNVDFTNTLPGSLVSFMPNASTSLERLVFTSNTLTPTDLQTSSDKTQLYFRAVNASGIGPIFRMGYNNNSVPDLKAPFIPKPYYGLGIDPKDGSIYGGTGTFTGSDQIIRYTSLGAPVDSAATGSGPNSFVFYRQ